MGGEEQYDGYHRHEAGDPQHPGDPHNNGFDAGKPDGEMGKKTVVAIKAFQNPSPEPTAASTTHWSRNC